MNRSTRKNDAESAALVGEEARLLLPSPNSTSRPSLTNLDAYGALTGESIGVSSSNSSNAYRQQIHLSSHLSMESEPKSCSMVVKRNKKTLQRLILAAITVSAFVIYTFCSHLSIASQDVVPDFDDFDDDDHSSATNAGHRIASFAKHKPFSLSDPVTDLKLHSVSRDHGSSPPALVKRDEVGSALPTNAWYQNLLVLKDGMEPTDEQRVYPVPYVVDVAGPIRGIRAHHPNIFGMSTVVQVTFVNQHALTLGSSAPLGTTPTNEELSKAYTVNEMTPLGVTLEWGQEGTSNQMSSSIVRGMAYTTMTYHNFSPQAHTLPTLVSEIDMTGPLLIDQADVSIDNDVICGVDAAPIRVEGEIQLYFTESDFTWLIFFSRPVMVRCNKKAPKAVERHNGFTLQVVDVADVENLAFDGDLTVRVALMNDCTKGTNPTFCGIGRSHRDSTEYGRALREHAVVFPGRNTDVTYSFDKNNDSAIITMDWDPQVMGYSAAAEEERELDADQRALIMYALPHHLDTMHEHPLSKVAEWDLDFCIQALLGHACAVQGPQWTLRQKLTDVSFRAPRSPRAIDIPPIARALEEDVQFKLPDYFKRGAGDTYFSGKMLAKLGRILLIAEELEEICASEAHEVDDEVASSCAEQSLPSAEDFDKALGELRSSVEIWFNGTAETPFVYDPLWGGMVSCGCLFNGWAMKCDNQFPNCPSFQDPGLNFGNGFYNDHHFHYGYHIYAAAVVAHFDPEWGRKTFEHVLLYIRDIANPSPRDRFFPAFRHKDWFQGSSWASGIAVSPLNGRNQESSSEAIASYEAVGLYGNVMAEIWNNTPRGKRGSTIIQKNRVIAERIRDVGRLLTATELRSAHKYWHVDQTVEEKKRIYPVQYTPHVVGVMWNTMSQFQTWFGNAPYLPYGIQLLPLTPIAEERDNQDWARQMYDPFAESCHKDAVCEEQGWSILEMGMLATVGHRDLAMERLQKIPSDVFESAGGNGHSLTNSLWYVSTRPGADPLALKGDSESSKEEPQHPAVKPKVTTSTTNCGCPDTCTQEVLNSNAGGFTCVERMDYLIQDRMHHEKSACHQVAGIEYPKECGGCDPDLCGAPPESEESESDEAECEPCSKEICQGKLNVCPIHNAPYLCTEGSSIGGCSRAPWETPSPQCLACCELTPGCEED